MASRKQAPKKLPKAPKRNFAAKQATNQKAVVMKDRREQRGGAKNTMRQDLGESE
jgi:hypothetical protein